MTGGLSYFIKEYTGLNTHTTISPLWNNIICALFTVIYIKIILDVASLLREKLGFNADISRKFIHVCAGCWILFWPLFDVTHWSWRLNILVHAVMSVKLFYKGFILKDPDDLDVQTMSRSSSPSELLYGPLQFTLFMMYCGTTKFMTIEGALLMASLGIGDGIAPIVGRYYGNIRYRFPLGGEKSVEGSFFGVFLGTIGGSYFFIHMLGLPMLPYQTLIKVGLISTIAEATSPLNGDNIFVPLVLILSLKHYIPSLSNA
jgi:phytol kinase